MEPGPVPVVEENCPTGTFLRSDSDNSRLSGNAVLTLDASGIIGELRNPASGMATVTNGCEFFQPTWREFSATLARKQDPSGAPDAHSSQPVHSRTGQGGGSMGGDRESGTEENDALAKEFMAVVGEYFDVEGGKPRVELRLNTAALGTRRGPPSSSSDFRGVTRHRRTKKWESHIWYDKRQLYLGGFKVAVDAAKAHDIMGLKLKRSLAHTNFEPQGYQKLMRFLEKLPKETVIDALRMCSKGNGAARVAHRNRAPRIFRKSPMPRNRQQDIGGTLALRTISDMDRNVIAHPLSVADNIHATLLPRAWSTDRQIPELKQGASIRHHPRLSGGNMVDYVHIPGHLNGACEVFDSSWRPEKSEPPSTPFVLADRQAELLAMDASTGPCHLRQQDSCEFDVARRRMERPRETNNKIVLTFPNTGGEGLSMPRGMMPSLQELLNASGDIGEQGQIASTSGPNSGLFQSPDTLFVKVPVIPSKVIRYPAATLSAPSFPPSASFPMSTSTPVVEQQMAEEVPMQFIVPRSTMGFDGGNRDGSSLNQVMRTSARDGATRYGVGLESQQQQPRLAPSENNLFPFGISDGRSETPTSDIGNSGSLGDAAY
ncbi:hypothetical protein BSKO_06049 [Bryopsis sp. KO-2023]|nr:hypothetical protein BSKO_06049 [Bryopsis sp. KO-2023]